jgi:hypothetical protein
VGVDAVIRRKDGRPFGTPEEVKETLSAAFPGIKLALVRLPKEIVEALSTNFPGMERIQWDGMFNRDGLGVSFYFVADGPVHEITISMYGRIDKMYDYMNHQREWKVDLL